MHSSKKLSQDNILQSGTRVIFERNNRKYDLQIIPGNNDNLLICHLNIHHNNNTINFTKLQKDLEHGFKELVDIINCI